MGKLNIAPLKVHTQCHILRPLSIFPPQYPILSFFQVFAAPCVTFIEFPYIFRFSLTLLLLFPLFHSKLPPSLKIVPKCFLSMTPILSILPLLFATPPSLAPSRVYKIPLLIRFSLSLFLTLTSLFNFSSPISHSLATSTPQHLSLLLRFFIFQFFAPLLTPIFSPPLKLLLLFPQPLALPLSFS